MNPRPDFPSDQAYAGAAWLLRCEEAAVRAVAEVEAGPQGAFLDSGEPVILFERHYFHRLTAGRYAGARAPGLPDSCSLVSSPRRGGYGPTSVQHARLAAAVALDRDAALRSASWGLFQVMGSNHAAAGYQELQRFVTAMYRSVDDHLRAFTMFVRHDARLVDAVRTIGRGGEVVFARVYNGPKYAENQYDSKILAAYRRWRR